MTQSAEVAAAVVTGAVGTGAGPGAVQPPSRRDRLRAATIDEIIQTARQLLVKDGPEAVSLRAIAREMGMTAPGLYRYFGSYEELHRYLCANIFTELGADIGRAIEAATAPSDDPHVKLTVKMVAACREFRRWALTHKDEFALVFGVPLPGLDDGRYDIADECALAFAGTFFTLFLELWHKVPFGVPDDEQIDPALRDQLSRYRDALGTSIALLDGAVRRGGDGSVRPPEVRTGGLGAHVRDHPRRPGHPGRPALPASGLGGASADQKSAGARSAR